MYQIAIATSLSECVSEKEYRSLVEVCVDATVFNDWPWLSTTIDYLSEGQQFTGISVRAGESQLVGFLALRVATESLHGIPSTVARFVQYPLGDRIAVLLHPDHRGAWDPLLDYLQQLSRSHWDCMIWNEWIDTQGLLVQSVQWAEDNKASIFHHTSCQCPVLSLNFDTEEEMLAGLSKKKRSDLRWRTKKLDKLNSEILHFRPSAEETVDWLEKIRLTEAESWKGDEGVGIFNNSDSSDFFKVVSKRLAKSDQLDLSVINIDGELASYRYGFYFRNTFFDYSIGYLPQYTKLGLGRILLHELVNSLLREGYAAVDASRVGIVTGHLLAERTDDVVSHYQFYWFGNSIKGQLLKLLVVRVKPGFKLLREKYQKWKTARGAEIGKAEK